MAKKTTATANATAVSTLETLIPHEVVVNKGQEPMRNALIAMCNRGNKKAMTAADALDFGADVNDFSSWTFFVNVLRERAVTYGKLVSSKESSDKDIKKAQVDLQEQWQKLLTKTADEFHPNFFIRQQDADTLRVYAYNMAHLNVPGLGSVATVTPSLTFRKMVEMFIGLRIRANDALEDADRDILASYLGAKQQLATAEERRDGRDTDNGHQAGLLENLDSAEVKLVDSLKMLENFGINKDTAYQNPAVITLVSTIDGIKKDLEQCNKTITDAKEVISKYQDRYNEIISKVNRIEFLK